MLDGNPTRETWHRLWAGAVAVVGMCSSRNQIGWATIQCKVVRGSHAEKTLTGLSSAGSSRFEVHIKKLRLDQLGTSNATVVPTLRTGGAVRTEDVTSS